MCLDFTAYYANVPDSSAQEQWVAFGSSGHRGSAFKNSFNEWHVIVISQAICDYRNWQSIDSPLFLGIDTHALSVPACVSALEVLTASETLDQRESKQTKSVLNRQLIQGLANL
jgi:phosphoglucomutase